MMKRSVRLFWRVRLPSAGLPQGRLRPGKANARTALSAAMRVAGRVLRRATHRRPAPEPSFPPRFAQFDIAMIRIADLANRRHAARGYITHLAAGQAQRGAAGLPARAIAPRSPPNGPSAHRGPARVRCYAPVCRVGYRSAARRYPGAAGPSCHCRPYRPPKDPAVPICSASRHLHIPTRRCAPNGSGHIRY